MEQFIWTIKQYYATHRRSFPWRKNITPYHVLVSEIMLQQTQTERVLQKFTPFITQFPTIEKLGQAPFSQVLGQWKGLGYNRRAIALHKIAQCVTNDCAGKLPADPTVLETFPGIGHATARSIVTFAFNTPTVFIETNIKTVFIYFFFKKQNNISDKQITPLIEETVDRHNPREWYYALMDYGVMLKKTIGNVNRLSSHYHKQSKFEGSERQVRGMILQQLLETPNISQEQLSLFLAKDHQLINKLVNDLCKEGFLSNQKGLLKLK